MNKISHSSAALKLLCLLGAVSVLLVSGCATSGRAALAEAISKGRVEQIGELPVLHLTGSPYEMGLQHGALLKEEVRASVANISAFSKHALGLPLVGGWFVNRRLDRAWRKMLPHIPERYIEELRGLSRGSGIPMKTLQRIHALPDLTSTHCASFAAFGGATQDGRLIQIRNLDWSIRSNVQKYAALMVHHPEGYEPFVNIGWLGFIGVISGISQEGISVSEIGAETVDQDLRGTPMPFLLRRVLEESKDLDRAVQVIDAAPRTGGFNYLFADAKVPTAVVLETTRRYSRIFWADQEKAGPHRYFVANAIFRSDFALDLDVRDLQLACNGNPRKPGLESPEGASAYEIRYLKQGKLLTAHHGAVTPEVAMEIARAIAPSSNIQSVVYRYPDLWVATAEDRTPAAQREYQRFDLKALLESR